MPRPELRCDALCECVEGGEAAGVICRCSPEILFLEAVSGKKCWRQVSRVGAKFKYSGSLSSVAFSPDGKRIVMGRTEDIFAEIWDVETSLAAKVK